MTSVTSKSLTVKTEDGTAKTVSTEKLLAVVPLKAATATGAGKTAVWLELVDGSKLVATSYTVAKRDAAAAG